MEEGMNVKVQVPQKELTLKSDLKMSECRCIRYRTNIFSLHVYHSKNVESVR